MTTVAPSVGRRGELRSVHSVTFIRFKLTFIEPGAVTMPGAPNRHPDVEWGKDRAHLVLDTDPWNRPHLPGTSLAGALRQMIRDGDGQDTADALFGRLLPTGTGGEEVDALASQIWVLGTRPINQVGDELSELASEVRASTAISRERGAAESNTLRVEELLPAGSSFEVFLRWDGAPAGRLARFLNQLAAWRPMIGRGVSRGRGRCETGPIRYGTLNLDDPDDLQLWLTRSGPELIRAVAVDAVEVTEDTPVRAPASLLQVVLRIIGPLRVGSGEPPERTGVSGQQVTPMFRSGGRYVIPASGLKGLLRSRAEYILRSVHYSPRPCENQRCGTCWVCKVFGFGGGNDANVESVGARALIRISDAVIESPQRVVRQHVAIDRFTGGAQDRLLYTVEALEGGRFTVRIDELGELTPERRAEIRAVLRLIFDDLNDGIVGIGAGVTRGYGSVTADLDVPEARGDLPGNEAARRQLARMTAEGPATSAPESSGSQHLAGAEVR